MDRRRAPVTVKVGSTTIATLGTTDNPLEETVGDSGVFEVQPYRSISKATTTTMTAIVLSKEA